MNPAEHYREAASTALPPRIKLGRYYLIPVIDALVVVCSDCNLVMPMNSASIYLDSLYNVAHSHEIHNHTPKAKP